MIADTLDPENFSLEEIVTILSSGNTPNWNYYEAKTDTYYHHFDSEDMRELLRRDLIESVEGKKSRFRLTPEARLLLEDEL